MPLRPCLGTPGKRCGKLTPNTRCPECARVHERNRTQRPTNLTRDWAERQRRAATVAEHRGRHGEHCPGWRRPPHPVVPPNVLTADHRTAVADGGDPRGELTVLCRVCNSAKSGRRAGGTPPT